MPLFPPQIPHGLTRAKPGLRGERPANNDLSHVTAMEDVSLIKRNIETGVLPATLYYPINARCYCKKVLVKYLATYNPRLGVGEAVVVGQQSGIDYCTTVSL
jgi:hypothetical protein